MMCKQAFDLKTAAGLCLLALSAVQAAYASDCWLDVYDKIEVHLVLQNVIL